MIYQLAKTSPLITGQVKLDLITDSFENDSRIYVNDLMVTPIADSIYSPITLNQKNNTHMWNIRELYKNIKGMFFQPHSNRSDLSGKYLYIGDDEPIDTTYMMGSRRSKTTRYGKSFEYLLPLYVDNRNDVIDENGKLKIRFDFVVKSTRTNNKDKELLRQTITLDDAITKYIIDYFKNVDNDLMYISYGDNGKNRMATMHGIKLTSGQDVTMTMSTMVPDMISTERTMYQFDNMILDKFASNEMIAHQILNLCFHFNFDDIITKEYRKSMLFDRFNVYVDCLTPYHETVNGVDVVKYRSVQIRDIYSNYEKINAFRIDYQGFDELEYSDKLNVFDYLKDDKCVDLMHTNKMMQSVFHFSYYDNDKIMFNLYNGFSPYISESGTDNVVQIQGLYCNQPDILVRDYSKYKRNTEFINFYDERYSFNEDIFEVIGMHMNQYDTTRFDFDDSAEVWRNMLRYNNNVIFSKELGKTYSILTPSKTTMKATDNVIMARAASRPISASGIESYTLKLGDEDTGDNNGLTNICVNSVALKANYTNETSGNLKDTGMFIIIFKEDSYEGDSLNYFTFASCGNDLNRMTWQNMRAIFTSSFEIKFKYVTPTDSDDDIYMRVKRGMNTTYSEMMSNDMYIFKVFKLLPRENSIIVPTDLEQRMRYFNTYEQLNAEQFEYCVNMFLTFSNMLSALIIPNVITFDRTIVPVRNDIPMYADTQIVDVDGKRSIMNITSVKGQSLYSMTPLKPTSKKQTTDEVRYMKSLDTTTLYRYSGRILPQFISLSDDYPYYNFIYRKKRLSDISNDDLKMFTFYEERNVDPDYKSIGYYTLESKRMTEEYPFDDKMEYFECKYLHDNVLCFNERQIEIHVDSDTLNKKYGEYVLNDELLFQLFKDYVFEHTDDYDEDIVRDDLYPLYRVATRFEYMEKVFMKENDLNRYYYTITYTTKV